jgi:hypothetical protein
MDARHPLGHTPLGPGRAIDGSKLENVVLQHVTTELVAGFRVKSSGHGLKLIYRGARGALVIEEAPTRQRGYGFETATLGTSGALPPSGEAALLCEGARGRGCAPPEQPLWQAQLRKAGLFITIRSLNRGLVIKAARALRPDSVTRPR